MRLNPALPRNSVAPLQTAAASPSAPASEHSGLQRIRSQSHHEAGQGLGAGLRWRDAKTLGLGRLAQSLLGLGGRLLQGLGALGRTLGQSTIGAGERLRASEDAGRFKRGLGYATQGLGLILKGAGHLLQGVGTVGTLGAKPVGALLTGLEKAGDLGCKGLGRAALALEHRLSPPQGAAFRQAVEAAAQSGLRITADQVGELARHLQEPSQHPWPAGLDASLKDVVGQHISAAQVSQLAEHLQNPTRHPWPASLDPAIRGLIQTHPA